MYSSAFRHGFVSLYKNIYVKNIMFCDDVYLLDTLASFDSFGVVGIA